MQELIFIHPSLLAEFRINAEWTESSIEYVGNRTISHRYPIPGTIASISIESLDPSLESLRTAPLPKDPHFGARGYLTPIPENPTEAERVFLHMYRYTGQSFRPDTCGCKIYEVVDRETGDVVRKQHPSLSRKCEHHTTDDDVHTAARGDNSLKNTTVAALLEVAPARFVETQIDPSTAEALKKFVVEPQWSFDVNRNLSVTLNGLTTPEKNSLRTALRGQLDDGRVTIS